MAAAVRISPDELRAEPGAEALAAVTITNLGTIVERYRFELLGFRGDATFEPPSVSILPGGDETTEVRISVPADAAPGPTPIAVRVVAEAGGESVVEEATLVVGGRTAVVGDLRPKTSTARRTARHVVYLTNTGNTTAQVVLTAGDEDDLLSFALPAQEQLRPHEEKAVSLRVRLQRKPERGERFAFNVTYDDGNGPQVLDGAVRGTRGRRWPIVAGLVALLAVAFGLTLLREDGPGTGAQLIGTSTSGSPAGSTDPNATTTPSGPQDTGDPGGTDPSVNPTPSSQLTTTTVFRPPSTTSTTFVPPTSQRQSAERLLVAWSQKDWEATARYATPAVVELLKTHDHKPGQSTSGQALSGTEVVVSFTSCDTTRRGLVSARYPATRDANAFVATTVAFCNEA